MPSPPPAPDLLRFATCALQLHHHTALPEHDRPADRAELDALPAHTPALFALLDTRTTAT
ncbi:DUF6238 family protein, partial [Peterkaempfera griseoplana]|uniref:DUF6238 family protein n=1 Tax=Peterkaempfera griseoplana TaxID=66896 RepID=UPI00389AC90A